MAASRIWLLRSSLTSGRGDMNTSKNILFVHDTLCGLALQDALRTNEKTGDGTLSRMMIFNGSEIIARSSSGGARRDLRSLIGLITGMMGTFLPCNFLP